MAEFNATVFLQVLAHFTGSETRYRHGLMTTVLFTEGAKYVADKCRAYWLLDEIAINQTHSNVGREELQVWIFTVRNQSGVLTCEDGNYRTVFKKKIEYTNFPLSEFKLYLCSGTIMLPGEY